MKIAGLQKTTLLDYPGHVAATIFLGGCNFRCPFCHNMNLVIENQEDVISEEEVLEFLKKRINVLDGVCITGGEPTLNEKLEEFIVKIKDLTGNNGKKLLVKLDTNGTNPQMLEKLIAKKLIDYVAMDIKSSVDEYLDICGIKGTDNADLLLDKVQQSIKIIMQMENYEFRTTIINEYHKEATMHKIGDLIKGSKSYFLQSFTDSEYVRNHSLSACDKETLGRYAQIMRQYVKHVDIRGVD